MLRVPQLWLGKADPEAPIDRPIFLLGVQGGGLTLVSRMLRRHADVVSVSGNHEYWTGADEMQNVLGPILPAELTGIKHKVPPDPMFSSTRSWTYATDQLLPAYRCTRADANDERRANFRRLLAWIVAGNGGSPNATRFTDKSQLYTVKVSYLDALLEGCEPRFLLVVRDPYAMCVRAERLRDFRPLQETHSFEERLDLTAQHWKNSIRCAVEDGDRVAHFKAVRFEDILREPEREMREICEFVDIAYDRELTPQPHHEVPRGSQFRERWHPLRTDLNDRYHADLDTRGARVIEERCGEWIRRFGYERPASNQR
jgi:hypothetical protein